MSPSHSSELILGVIFSALGKDQGYSTSLLGIGQGQEALDKGGPLRHILIFESINLLIVSPMGVAAVAWFTNS